MIPAKFSRLRDRNIITEEQLDASCRSAAKSGEYPEELPIRNGIPKHEILFSLSSYYEVPYEEFDEGVLVSHFITMRLDMEQLKRSLWLPL